MYERPTGVRGIKYQVIMETIMALLLTLPPKNPEHSSMNSIWKTVVNRYSGDGRLQFTLAIFGGGVRRTRMPRSVGLTRIIFPSG